MATIRVYLEKIPLEQSKALTRQEQLLRRKKEITLLRNGYLSELLNTTIQDADFERTEYGKPYLKDHPKFSFNQSHSQKYYALTSSHTVKDVGIDIEELTRQVKFDALAQHAFHPDEYQQWKALDENVEYWFKVWTTKEAVLKASGLGIRIGLKQLNTQTSMHGTGGMCQHEKIGSFAYQHYVLGDAMLTVAWRAELSCKGFQFPHIILQQD